MSDVFISYSRQDRAFVKKLFDALQTRDRDVWVDWEDIEYAEDWWHKICAGIEAADNFVFVITPASVRSKVCFDEIDYAARHNKRIVPILHEEITEPADKQRMHPVISRHNWLPFTDDDILDRTFNVLLETIHREPEHVRSHTRLLTRAREWEQTSHNPSLLLRGEDLLAAEQWLTTGVGKDPVPLPLHSEYILASRAAERRGQRRLLTGVSVALVVALGLALLSFIMFQNANTERERADSNAATSVYNEQQAISAQQTSEANLKAAWDSQALFAADLSQQQLEAGAPQTALLLALESLAHYPEIHHPESVRALIYALSGSTREVITFSNSLIGRLNPLWNRSHTRLLTSPTGSDLTLWDVATAAEIFNLPHDGVVMGVVWSVDEQHLVSWDLLNDQSSKVYIWDALTGRNLLIVPQKSRVNGLTLQEDGSRLLVWGSDWVASWDANNGVLLQEFIDAEEIYTLNSYKGAQWMANGEKVLAWSWGGFRIWDAATGEQIVTVNKPISSRTDFYNVELKPDEREILVVSGNSVVIFSSATGEMIRIFESESQVSGSHWINNGTQIISYGYDGVAHLWDAATGDELAQFEHSVVVLGTAISPDNDLLLTSGGSGIVRTWDIKTGVMLAHIEAGDQLYGAVWSPNGKMVMTWESQQNAAKVWDALTGDQLFTLAGDGWIEGASWGSSDNQALTWTFSSSDNQSVHLWDLAQMENRNPVLLGTHEGEIYNARWLESKVLSYGDDEMIRLWDVESRHEIMQIPIGSYMSGIAVGAQAAEMSPDRHQVLTLSDHGLMLWNVTGSEMLWEHFPSEGEWLEGAFWIDDSRIASWWSGNTVKILDAETGEASLTIPTAAPISYVRQQPDGSQLLIVMQDSAMLFNEESSETLLTLPKQNTEDFGWSRDGKKLLKLGLELFQWLDAATGEVLLTIDPPRDYLSVDFEDFDADLKRMLVTVEGSLNEDDPDRTIEATLILYNTETGDILRTMALPASYVEAKFQSNDRLIVSYSLGEPNSEIQVWDADTGVLLLQTQPEDAIWNVVISDDGQYLAWWSDDNLVHVFDIEMQIEIMTFPHEGVVKGAYWSQDGMQLMTWTDQGRLYLWENNVEFYLNLAQQYVIRDLSEEERQMFFLPPASE